MIVCSLLLSASCFSVDRNLMIIVDNLQQETVKTQEVNMTHQCITALQQRAGAVLMSVSLWKNIIDRKERFEKDLQDQTSLSFQFFNLYKTTLQELQALHYNLPVANAKLSQSWFAAQFPALAELQVQDLNQLRFDFACYMFDCALASWKIYHAQEGMLLFVPQELNYAIDQAFDCARQASDNVASSLAHELCKHSGKKSHVILSLQKLIMQPTARWIVYLAGHGHPKSSKQGANIAGMKIEEFQELLDYFQEQMQLKLLVYSSCYGGGLHTLEPYANKKFHYPIIVTAATDAPIFGFGLFEGTKLPPYDAQFKLESADVSKKQGLLPCALQNYGQFFKRAWKGQFDLHLVQCISKFFMCDLLLCHVQKVENFPLIRKANSIVFVPVKDSLIIKLVQQVTSYSSVVATKPIFLYTKKVKKIKMDKVVPVISMLPGLQTHQIDKLIAPQISLEQLITQTFVSLEDMQAYKNFMIKNVTCIDDLSDAKKVATFDRILILGQEHTKPRFVDKKSDMFIYVQCGDQHYQLLFDEQKIVDKVQLSPDQVFMIDELIPFLQMLLEYDATLQPEQLLDFDIYLQSKEHQQGVVESCVKKKVCKK